MMDKTLTGMQKQVDDFISQYKAGYFHPTEQMLRMTEEVGELAREINHHFGPKKKKENEEPKELSEEMGDVLFVLISLANSLDINLENSFSQTMKKYIVRDHDRFERK